MPLFKDRAGRFSPLLTVTLALLVAPAIWLAIRAANGDFSGAGGPPIDPFGGAAGPGPGPGGALAPGGGPAETPFGPASPGAPAAGDGGAAGARPIYDAIHFSGEWAVRFLLLSLAVTPFRRLLHWPRLQLVRRRVGLAALAYAAGHLLLYIVDQQFDLPKIATEIVLRVYLAIGFVALAGLIALGATSTDGAVKRLGAERWNRLHKLAYVIAGLAVLHFAMQAKLDVTEPMLMWGLFLWAMGWRRLQRTGERAISPVWLAGLAVVAAIGTALSEAAWYGLATGVDAGRVLSANFDPAILAARPCWWVLLFGLLATGVSFIGARRRGPARQRAAPGSAHARPVTSRPVAPEGPEV